MPMTRAARRVHRLFDGGDMDGVWNMIEEECSVSPDVLDGNGRTMLHKSIGDTTMIKTLTMADANPNIPVRECGLGGHKRETVPTEHVEIRIFFGLVKRIVH